MSAKCADPRCTYPECSHRPPQGSTAGARGTVALIDQVNAYLDDPSGVDRLRAMRIETATRELRYIAAVAAHGGQPYHGVNHKATAKRRARNRAAAAVRRAKRG